MKCGYFSYTEYNTWVRYDCRYFGFSCNTEKCLCQGCTLDGKGVPHMDGWEDLEEEQETDDE